MPAFVARYRSKDGRPMIGGVKQSSSSAWSHEEDAAAFLASVISINASAGCKVVGEIIRIRARPVIVRHCPEGPAQAIGEICPACGARIPRK